MNLSVVCNDPNKAENFIVLRSQGGAYVQGKWVEPAPQMLSYFGVISQATPRDIEALPEGDRVHDMIVVNCELPLYVTRIAGTEQAPGNQQGTSDVIVWNNEKWRVMKPYNYASRGYWYAMAARIKGA